MTIEHNKNDIRCMVCRSEFVEDVLKQNKEQTCPICKTSIKPMRIQNDGFIKVNWEEIRLVSIYAQRWAEKFDKTNPANMEYLRALRNIIDRIQLYIPRGARNLDPVEQVPRDKDGKLTKAIPSPYLNL